MIMLFLVVVELCFINLCENTDLTVFQKDKEFKFLLYLWDAEGIND